MNDAPELRLLLEQHRLLPQPKRAHAAAGSIAAHVLAAALIAVLPAPTRLASPEITYRSTPLVAPPLRLTERAPNTGTPRDEVNLSGLLARRAALPVPPSPPSPTLPAAPRKFEAPPNAAPLQPPVERPQLETKAPELLARNLPEPGANLGPGFDPPKAVAPPPQIEPAERPKLTFETPQAQMTGRPSGTGGGLVEAPRPPSIEETARTMARGGGAGLAVGDVGAPGAGGLGEALGGAPGLHNASSLELLSDPMGADFRPYLIQILSMVRRNWRAVLPESVRLGRRGRVQIQFAIDRSGNVPKLVIAMPSGAEALDRAAVAGISASNPFPPLPPEFKGNQVRLQFTFLYNVPK